MELTLRRGRYEARWATTGADLRAAQHLRHRRFIEAAGLPAQQDGLDVDAFDADCEHLIISERSTHQVVGCCRLMLLPSGQEIENSYSAQFYDLGGFGSVGSPLAELGRFCIADGQADPDLLRIAWGAITRKIDAHGATYLFGCSSFAGTDPAMHAAAFTKLWQGHIGATPLRPKPRAAETVPFAGLAAPHCKPKPVTGIPPLLRTYLSMGGWVSDHAVVDRILNTMHVFTALEIAKVPAARARALRAIAS